MKFIIVFILGAVTVKLIPYLMDKIIEKLDN